MLLLPWFVLHLPVLVVFRLVIVLMPIGTFTLSCTSLQYLPWLWSWAQLWLCFSVSSACSFLLTPITFVPVVYDCPFFSLPLLLFLLLPMTNEGFLSKIHFLGLVPDSLVLFLVHLLPPLIWVTFSSGCLIFISLFIWLMALLFWQIWTLLFNFPSFTLSGIYLSILQYDSATPCLTLWLADSVFRIA